MRPPGAAWDVRFKAAGSRAWQCRATRCCFPPTTNRAPRLRNPLPLVLTQEALRLHANSAGSSQEGEAQRRTEAARARAALGRCLAACGRHVEAAAHLEVARSALLSSSGSTSSSSSEEVEDVVASLADACYASGEWSRAISLYASLLTRTSNTSDRGEALGDSHVRRPIRLPNRRRPEVLNNLGNALRAVGRLEEAAGCYVEACRLLTGTGGSQGEDGKSAAAEDPDLPPWLKALVRSVPFSSTVTSSAVHVGINGINGAPPRSPLLAPALSNLGDVFKMQVNSLNCCPAACSSEILYRGIFT